MSLQPSESLDDIALRHVGELPASARNALAGLGALGPAGAKRAGNGASNGSGAAALASYLLFEPGFVNALMDMGQRDAYAQKSQLLEFFSA
jgi:NTE family protein